MTITQQPLTRAEISAFAPTPRAVKFFENISANVTANTQIAQAIANGSFVTLTVNDALTGERVLAVTPPLAMVDGGAGGNVTLSLGPSGVTAGTYGSAGNTPIIQFDAYGRAVAASSVATTVLGSNVSGDISGNAANVTGIVSLAHGGFGVNNATADAALNSILPTQTGNAGKVLQTNGSTTSWQTVTGGGGAGTVTSITAGTGLSGGTITVSGTIALANTAVTPASYGTASSVGQFTVDAQGRISTAANVAIAITGAAVSGNIAGNAANVTGIVALANGGFGVANASATAALTSILPSQTGQAGKVLGTNGTVQSWVAGGTITSIVGGTGITVTSGTGPAATVAIDSTVATLTGAQTLSSKAMSGASNTFTNLPISALTGGPVGVALGGTGAATFTAGYLKASGTTAFTTVAAIPGADVSGNISGNAANVTGIVALANGGLGVNNASTTAALTGLLPSQTGQSGKVLGTNGTVQSWVAVTGGTVTSVGSGTGLTGGPITGSGTLSIDSTVVTLTGAQTLTNKVISGSSNTLSNIPYTAITGTVTIGTGLSGAPTVLGNGTLSLSTTGVGAGSYGDATHVASYTVDAQGRLSASSAVAIAFPIVSVTAGTGITVTGGSASVVAVDSSVALLTATQSLSNKTFDLLRTSQTPTAAVMTSTHYVPIVLNGVTYKLLVAS